MSEVQYRHDGYLEKIMNEYKVTGIMEDEIYRVSTFIRELQRVQDRYFKELVQFMNEHQKVDERTEDFLFDYIYNEENPETFDEYLDKFKK
jgi:hypothetical protein